MRYTNRLEISPAGKAVPYGGTGELRDDGDANYGFKDLKGSPQLQAGVPELQRDPALRHLVATINAPHTGLFSVGCVSAAVEEEGRHRMSGYVEFALNSDEAAADAGSYFPAFFHFDRALRSVGFDEGFHFGWELMEARFVQAEVDGFTATVYLNTDFHSSAKDARETWDVSLAFLAQFLASIPPMTGAALYPPPPEPVG